MEGEFLMLSKFCVSNSHNLLQDIWPDLTLLSLRPTIATVRAEFMRRILLCREEAHWDNAWSTVCSLVMLTMDQRNAIFLK